jgi:hypothetical protein
MNPAGKRLHPLPSIIGAVLKEQIKLPNEIKRLVTILIKYVILHLKILKLLVERLFRKS